MDYTALRNGCITLCRKRDIEQVNEQRLANATREIGRSFDFAQPAAISCQQQAFLPQYNDKTIADRYTAKFSETKSPCITMGFCNARRYTSELLGVSFQTGERL
jgi:hypothetical protein